MKLLAPTLDEIRAARERLAGSIVRTPLLPLNLPDAPAAIWLKPENLQPIGSFKLRGAGNAMRLATKSDLARGVFTVSAGNMAQGVAWNARTMGVPCSVLVPEKSAEVKAEAVRRLGAEVIRLPFEEWWQVMLTHRHAGHDGYFIHPVCNSAVMAGNGTIGLEVLEDLPEVDAVLIPFGGGGLSMGIACAVRALKPGVKIIACEVDTAAPLSASLKAGAPQTIEFTPNFVDGIGGPCVLDDMWPLVSQFIDEAIAVSLDEVRRCIRLLAERNHLIAEGAGAVALAAALTGKVAAKNIVCIVSGGNIDPGILHGILSSAQ